MSNPRIRFLLDGWSAFLRDRPRYSTSMLKLLVRRVDDGIHRLDGDVTLNDLDGLTRRKVSFDKNGVHTLEIYTPLGFEGTVEQGRGILCLVNVDS